MKPWFVKKLCEWNTCCCQYHTKINELKEGLNGMIIRGKGVHGGYTCFCTKICRPFGENICPPNECEVHVSYFKKLISIWSSILCPLFGFSTFHQRACLLGQCKNCGVETLKICPVELDLKKPMTWRKISYVIVGKNNDGCDKKVSRVEYCETQPSQLIGYLRPKLKELVMHNFMSKWQKKEFKSFVPNLPLNTILFCINFLENYAFKVQNEI